MNIQFFGMSPHEPASLTFNKVILFDKVKGINIYVDSAFLEPGVKTCNRAEMLR
jgi:hypothetical protein